jgi:predicted MFS family arabinose efflux permease
MTQPLSGKLTDIFGRRTGFLFCLMLFGVGNLVCGLGRSKATIILGRALAGIGGGGCNSITTFISSDLIPLRRRGVWHGMGMLVYCSGVGLGGVIGGVINETWGWRWAFIALTPFTLLSGVGIACFLPALLSSKEQGFRTRLWRIDFSGSVVLVVTIALLLVGLNQEDLSVASSRRVMEIALPLAAASFAVFVIIELYYAKEPVFPIELLAKRTTSGACLASWFTSMAVYTLMFYVPLYFQLRGCSSSQTGLRLLPEPIGGGFGSFMAGMIMRLSGRYGILKAFAFVLFLAGNTGFATVSMGTPSILTEIYLLVNGLGLGGILTVMLLALLSSVKHEHQAVATSIQYAFRSTGATIGISVSSFVFRQLLKSRIGQVTLSDGLASAFRPGDLGDVLRRCNRSTQSGHGDCPRLIAGYMYALHGTFLLAMTFAMAGFLCAMFTKNYQLRTSFSNDETEGNSHVNRDS